MRCGISATNSANTSWYRGDIQVRGQCWLKNDQAVPTPHNSWKAYSSRHILLRQSPLLTDTCQTDAALVFWNSKMKVCGVVVEECRFLRIKKRFKVSWKYFGTVKRGIKQKLRDIWAGGEGECMCKGRSLNTLSSGFPLWLCHTCLWSFLGCQLVS